MSNWNTDVKQFVDGVDTLSAASVNPAIQSLASRDQYLFEMLNNKSDKTVLISYNQPMVANFAPGTPVYFNTSSGQGILDAAKSGYISSTVSDHLEPAQNAFVFGVIKTVYGGTSSPYYGDVYIKGLVTDIDFSTVLDTESSNEGTWVPGPLYLSSTEPGKLTLFPSGAAIFVGYYIGGTSFVLAPNIDSLNQLYYNYHLFLVPKAAGTPALNGSVYVVNHSVSPQADMMAKVGWVNASDAQGVLNITPPSGASYYYNLPTNAVITNTTQDPAQSYYLTQEQIDDALLLKKALPVNPATYAMLFVNGVLQTQRDNDHTNGTYLIDENGIWWFPNTAGYTPWAQSGNPPTIELFLTKLNPYLGSSLVTSLTSGNAALTLTGSDKQVASTGDLTINLTLPVTSTSSTGYGTAVQSVTYNNTSGALVVESAPVINSLSAGPGLSLTSTVAGQYTLALTSFTVSGEVTDIEPEEAQYVFKGLHSYLRLANPQANQRIGFVGKVKIPDSIPPNTNFNVKLVNFIDAASISSSAPITFVFEYSVSGTNTGISSALTSSAVSVAASNFKALTQTTLFKDSSNNTVAFSIPYTAFSAGSYVNFRVARTNSSFSQMLGVIGVLWSIE